MLHLIILKTISTCIYLYLFLLIIRILFSWFKPSIDGKLWHYLCLLTGPYLRLFKGIKPLREGIFDFTPIVAISLLAVINQILDKLVFYFQTKVGFSLGILLSIMVETIWGILCLIIAFFAIVGIIRLLSILFHSNPNSGLLRTADLAIQPIIVLVMKFIPKRLDYIKLLFLTILLLAGLWLLAYFSFDKLSEFLKHLPF